MNILKVNMSVDPVLGGGTAERTMQLARALVELGHRCTVLTLDIGLSDVFKRQVAERGIEAIYMRCLAPRFYLPYPALGKISDAVREADVVHLMGHWTLINVLVYLFCLRHRKPYVVCPAGALPVFGRSRLIKEAFNRLVGRRLINRADAQVAVTPAELPAFAQYGVDPARVQVIPNGINPADFASADTAAFKSAHGIDGPMLLFMGRLNAIKGPDLLLEAFAQVSARFPAYRLVFAGPDGGMLEELRARAGQGRLPVQFVGYVGGVDKSMAYHAADLLVIPSRQEAMSIVVLEAGACGTPVLITDQCGFDDVEAVGGGRVVPATAEGLAEGLEGMLAAGELDAMGASLNRYVLENFQWRRAGERYLALYRDLLDTRSC